MNEALFYTKRENLITQCLLCPQECIIKDGQKGICSGKENRKGTLYAVNKDFTTSLAIDPIEKKPLYHFYPGANIFSIGPNGCNLKCRFCQNWQVSQKPFPTKPLPPEEAVRIAKENNCIGIAYTYSEPFIWFEYILETAALAQREGLKNVLVSNGFVNDAPLRKILPYIDAMNVDIKSMDDSFYRKQCAGRLDPVLNTVSIASKDCHIEVTNLIIPGLNDTDVLFRKLTDFIAAINPDIPLHFSRYFPLYKATAPPTPESTLKMAWEIAQKKLHYVYVGNINIGGTRNTRCHHCGNEIITRTGYGIDSSHIKEGACKHCDSKVPVIGL